MLPQRSSLNEQYTSKLDDFESYIARAKLAPLSLHKLEDKTEENALQQGLSQRCGRAEAPSAVCHRPTYAMQGRDCICTLRSHDAHM